jgi:poly(A) polymerase
MADPRVVPRAEHSLSRRDVDPDALKVLYRLHQAEHIAYLVGGGVRDLLLSRRPKDFDIGTSAHPQHVKKLFRNCWIIGRRFRLAHVKFGTKVIEVATFRRQVAAGEEVVADGVPAPDPTTPDGRALVHHDNTFGTPEEDAFRRDFTVNALFYDIATFSIIDYVGGLEDLSARVVRSIGDPETRIKEDPVRMLRAVALASRLDFTIDPPLAKAIRAHRHEIARSSPPRLIEEYYKILRAGAAEQTFRSLLEIGLLEPLSAELHHRAGDELWESLASLDDYRRRFQSTPETLTNPIVLGTLIVPLGIPLTGELVPQADGKIPKRPPGLKLGELPLARNDVERLRQILSLQRRLREVGANPRAKRALTHRSIFREALVWLDVHGDSPEIVEHWNALIAEGPGEPADATAAAATAAAEDGPPGRKRRRRRRRRRGHNSAH